MLEKYVNRSIYVLIERDGSEQKKEKSGIYFVHCKRWKHDKEQGDPPIYYEALRDRYFFQIHTY